MAKETVVNLKLTTAADCKDGDQSLAKLRDSARGLSLDRHGSIDNLRKMTDREKKPFNKKTLNSISAETHQPIGAVLQVIIRNENFSATAG